MGALPTLRAATDPGVIGGQYFGPDGFGEQRGYPKVVASSGAVARRRRTAEALDRVGGVDRRDVPRSRAGLSVAVRTDHSLGVSRSACRSAILSFSCPKPASTASTRSRRSWRMA